ncbi:SDR family oxidoreductase [Halalkalibacter urbisdiaboli]|uniref:SDR family oxidoreductase n=1 Tax=Halalkalibacter urbisdiaboli TaxID=1960589 RepID=UPI000B4421A2|nr:SDR family oxidoreductase [Halalkalibacter urbisdiaboli]
MNKEIVVITGTSSGFGFLSALALAKNGFFVVATMRDLSKSGALVKAARENNVETLLDIVQLDVNDHAQIVKTVSYVLNKYKKIDILINNAGCCVAGMTEELEVQAWRTQFETNFFSIVTLTKTVLPVMRQRRKGKIINVGSISGRIGFPGLGPYVSSKHALGGFSESLRFELLPFNIHVSLIEAGSFQTNIWDKALEQVKSKQNSDYTSIVKKVYKKAEHSAKSAGDPNEVVEIIRSICADDNPKFRYQIGKGVKATIFIKHLLPWRFFESVVKRTLYK